MTEQSPPTLLGRAALPSDVAITRLAHGFTTVRRNLRSAPATFGYLAVLAVTTVVLFCLGDRRAGLVILHASTNIAGLSHNPTRVLVDSAFWLQYGFGELANWIILFLVVVAPVERRLGTIRTAIAFAAGHIGATLLSQTLTAIAINQGLMGLRFVHAADVGASYGFASVAAVLIELVPPRWRLPYATVLGTWVIAVGLISTSAFTAIGHVFAVLIGLVIARSIRRSPPQARPQKPSTPPSTQGDHWEVPVALFWA